VLKRILIADDSVYIRDLIREFIEAESGFRVCGEAADGVEAVSKARELSPDLIVLDFSMPGMNGIEAARALLPIIPATPKILFTLHKDAVPDTLARSVGIGSVFSKTDGLSPLIAEIRRLLDGQEPAPGVAPS